MLNYRVVIFRLLQKKMAKELSLTRAVDIIFLAFVQKEKSVLTVLRLSVSSCLVFSSS